MVGFPSRYNRVVRLIDCFLHRFVSISFIFVESSPAKLKFQEFLDTVLLFSRGKTEDKLRIIFDMCDKDSNGVIDKEELSEMLRSLVEIARTTSLSDDHVTELIDGMFQVHLSYFHHRLDRPAVS